MQMTCEHSVSVSDADFGYWNSKKWGEPTVQEFVCGKSGEPVIYEEFHGGGGLYVVLCPEHKAEVNL